MGDDHRYVEQDFSSRRTLREYDFFCDASEKLKQEHVLPWPQNPDALQEFFLPELISPLHKKIRADSNKLMKTPGIVIKNAEPLLPATAGVFLFGKRLDDSPATAGVKDQELSPLVVYNPTPLRTVRSANHVINPNPNPPKFHEKILRGIQGAPVFLFDKKLEGLDTCHNRNEGRLTILKSEKVMSFLSEGERRIIVERGGGVTVILTEAENPLTEHKLVLALAAKKNNGDHVLVLKDEWWRVLYEERLKHGDLVEGWGYRRQDDHQFRLALKISPVRIEIRADSNKLMKTPVGKRKTVHESGIVIKNAAPKPKEPIPEPVFLFYKTLEYSDLKPGLKWLLIPKSEKLMGFLSEEERIKMEGGGSITVILEGVKEQELLLAKTKGSNDKLLLVKDDWWSFLSARHLRVGDHLMGWGYRRHDDAKFRLKISCIDGNFR